MRRSLAEVNKVNKKERKKDLGGVMGGGGRDGGSGGWRWRRAKGRRRPWDGGRNRYPIGICGLLAVVSMLLKNLLLEMLLRLNGMDGFKPAETPHRTFTAGEVIGMFLMAYWSDSDFTEEIATVAMLGMQRVVQLMEEEEEVEGVVNSHPRTRQPIPRDRVGAHNRLVGLLHP
ncbi:hypothetical protein LXL04_006033 [Taraxacum kok-saghyz]